MPILGLVPPQYTSSEGGQPLPNRISARATALTILGAVVGAGFASGQEVMQFFVKYGAAAVWGLLASTIGFALLTGWLATTCLRSGADNYQRLLHQLGGEVAAGFFGHVFAAFLWIGLTVMIAGSATLLSGLFPLPRLCSALLTAGLVYLVASRQTAGLVRANDLLMPCLIFLIVFFLLRSTLSTVPAVPLAPPSSGWLWSSLLYVALNSAILFVVIPPLVTQAENRRQAYLGAFGGVGLICLLLLGVIHLLSRHRGLVGQAEIPLLVIAQRLLPALPFLYAIPLWIALATTAFADAMGLVAYLQGDGRRPHGRWFPCLLLLAVALSQLGFANLVTWLYPLMGYACLAFCLFCLGRWLLKALTA